MSLKTTDPEFIERFEQFALGEVVNDESCRLDTETRHIAILATLIGCGGVEAFDEMLEKALNNGISPVVVKEIVYQTSDDKACGGYSDDVCLMGLCVFVSHYALKLVKLMRNKSENPK